MYILLIEGVNQAEEEGDCLWVQSDKLFLIVG